MYIFCYFSFLFSFSVSTNIYPEGALPRDGVEVVGVVRRRRSEGGCIWWLLGEEGGGGGVVRCGGGV